MKKTVIKRRKRVPAVGITPALAARQSSVVDTASPASQSAQLDDKAGAGGPSRTGSSSNLSAMARVPSTTSDRDRDREKERERHPANGLNSVGTNNVHTTPGGQGRPALMPSGSSGASHASRPPSAQSAAGASASSVPSHLQTGGSSLGPLGSLGGGMRGTSPSRSGPLGSLSRDPKHPAAAMGLMAGSGPAASSRSSPHTTTGTGGGGGLYADALGLRNRGALPGAGAGAGQPAKANAVPLNRAGQGVLPGTQGSERKKPWWIEPGEEDRRKASAAPKENVSCSA